MDVNETAFAIVNSIVSDSQPVNTDSPTLDGKNLAAVMLGRLGGLKGGKARAAKLSSKKRIEIARKAAKARWDSRPNEQRMQPDFWNAEGGSSALDEEKLEKARQDIYQKVSDSLNADILIYSGGISRALAAAFINEVSPPEKENVALILCTGGGDADAAYIIARYLKNHYNKFHLFVFGWCKSAGTLIALGANEIVMSNSGELGPLDVQIPRADDLFFRNSGLDISEAIIALSEKAFEIFETHFIEILNRGGGAITTHTAAEIASSLSVGLISPITSQIDPLRVGETKRELAIARDYGIRLNGNVERVNALIHNYPSHSFVIDRWEADKIFDSVRGLNEDEKLLETFLTENSSLVTIPDRNGIVGKLYPEGNGEAYDQQQQDIRTASEQVHNENGSSGTQHRQSNKARREDSADPPVTQKTVRTENTPSETGQ